MITLEYVASAWMNFNFLNSKDPELLKWASENYTANLKYMMSKLENNIFEFSGLYNAFYEPEQYERILECGISDPSCGHKHVYADSGGLQMMKQNLNITEEIKKNIMQNQAKYSDFAFIFDEIPSYNVDDTRVFVNEWVKPYGERTGQNLNTLLKVIKDNNSHTKAIPIVQGRGREQITEFTNAMLSQISKNDLKYIEAFAMGNAHGNGFGLLQSTSTFLSMKNIDNKFKKHIHLLGVTGFDRMIPILQLVKNGLFEHTEKISFDSSYHAKTYAFGNLQKSVEWCINGMQDDKLGLKRNKMTEDFFKELDDFWKNSPTYNIDEFDDYFKYSSWDKDKINTPNRQLAERDVEAYKKNVNIIQNYIFLNMYKYFEVLNKFMTDELTMEQILHSKKTLKIFQPLQNVYSLDELYDWENYAASNYKVQVSSSIDKAPFDIDKVTDVLF